jgi:hypothetical protein
MSFIVGNKVAKKKFLCLPVDDKSIETQPGAAENKIKLQTGSCKNTITINKHFRMVKNPFFTKIMQFNSGWSLDSYIEPECLEKSSTRIEKKPYFYPCQLSSSDTLVQKYKCKKQKELVKHVGRSSSVIVDFKCLNTFV